MTLSVLVDELKVFCEECTAHFELPTSLQKGDTEIVTRAPEVFKMRLPNSQDVKKYAPYILIQPENGIYKQAPGKNAEASVGVYLTFCVYDDDEQEGALMLLNVMDAVRIRLLQKVVIGKCFRLDLDAGLEFLIYREDTRSFYGGTIFCTFQLPPIQREVNL